MSSKQKKIKLNMSRKLLIIINLLCLVLCTTSCVSGYLQYTNTIKRLYNENAYAIGDIVLNELDGDKISQYTKTWEEDADYADLKQYLDDFVWNADIEYLFIVVPNDEDGTIKYVYDSTGMKIGETDKIVKFQDDIMEIFTTGENDRSNYFVRKSPKYGYMTSAILPVKDSGGTTVALLSIDIAMHLIISTLTEYIFKAFVISFLLMFLFSRICWHFLKGNLLTPIKQIEKCLKKFSNNNAEITKELKNIHTGDELESLSNTIYDMENSIVNYIDNITKITADKERITAELDVAKNIQAGMLPSVFPPFPDIKEFDIYATMTPAKEVGGDFYDFFMLDKTHVGIIMADVSGKGVPAALFMAITMTLIKHIAESGGTPADILSEVNNKICANESQMFVTVWLGILDIETGRILCSNAGHEYPAVKHNGKYEILKDKHGLVVGGFENYPYTNYEIVLEKGDSLFVYTDGVAEATDKKNNMFGMDRMLDALNSELSADCHSTIDNVQKSIDKFVNKEPQFDDITMLCIDYYGKNEMDDTVKEKTFEAKIENGGLISAFVESELEAKGCPLKIQSQINIVIDEIFSNIVFYGYKDEEGDVTVSISVKKDPGIIELTFTDSGKQYNPLEKEDPDISLAADERDIGGLGIFIVKKTMDEIDYKYADEKNVIKMIKYIK